MARTKVPKRVLLTLICLWMPLSGLKAEVQEPYLIGATFYISVDDWADIWLNGIPIIDSQPRTPSSRSYQTRVCRPAHLCYFQRENLLAIENTNAYQVPAPADDRVGIAYVLRLRFSDGTERTLSSDDVADHRAYFLPDRMTREPGAWHQMDFDDSEWGSAQATGTQVPYLAPLVDPETHQWVQFLSASGSTSKAQYTGERHLYRRKFFLKISQNPNCSSALVVRAIPTPVVQRMAASLLVPTFTPTLTATPIPVPPRSKSKVHVQQLRKIKPTPTATFDFVPRVTAEPMRPRVTIGPSDLDTPTPMPLLTVEPTIGEAQTIVFGKPPANIYVNFADGPGIYRLEVFNEKFRHARDLFEKKVVAQTDAWVEWDGKDDLGQDVPSGSYVVIYSKDGKQLNQIIVTKVANP